MQRLWGCDPQQVRKQFVGQLHSLCKVAMMRMNPAAYKLQNMFMPQEKTKEDTNFIVYCNRGFSGILGGVSLKFSPGDQPLFSLFPCFIPQCLKLGSRIAVLFLYRLSCYSPAFQQAKVGLPPFPRS